MPIPMPIRSAPVALFSARRLFTICALGFWLAGCSSLPGGDLFSQKPAEIGLESNLRLAAAALSGGDIDSALRLYRAGLREHPESVEAHKGLADAYYAIGAYPEARGAYQQFAALDGQNVTPLLGLGRVALASGDMGEAAVQFRRAIAVAPDDMPAQNGLAVALDLSGDHAAAQAIYGQLLERDPANRAVSNNLALSLALSGHIDQAIDSLADLVDGPTIMPEARHNLALAYALQGDEVSAQKLIREDLSPAAMGDTLAFYRQLGPAQAAR